MSRRFVTIATASLALLPLAARVAQAQVNCPPGQSVTMDTYGHCCFGGQVWAESKQACVGVPTCPTGFVVSGDTCIAQTVMECSGGKAVSQDTQGHCCWPGQAWSTTRGSCAGVPQCPTGLVAQGEDCQAEAPPPPPVKLGGRGESCRSSSDCDNLPCNDNVCGSQGGLVSQPPTVMVTTPPPPNNDMQPPALDTTRSWHFTEVATYDASMQGLGDFFTFDIPFMRLGNTNSSLSIGAGIGIIFSLAHDSNFAIPIPITLTGRFGFGTSIEIDARLGAVPYFYSVNAKTDYWGGKFDMGVSIRVPLSNGGMGLLAGVDVYVINGVVTLPEIGFTF